MANSFVYIIQSGDDGPIKIGVSNDPEKRIRALQTSNPGELHILYAWECKSAESLESYLHRKLDKHRLSGEWFEWNEDTQDAIEFANTVIRLAIPLGVRYIERVVEIDAVTEKEVRNWNTIYFDRSVIDTYDTAVRLFESAVDRYVEADRKIGVEEMRPIKDAREAATELLKKLEYRLTAVSGPERELLIAYHHHLQVRVINAHKRYMKRRRSMVGIFFEIMFGGKGVPDEVAPEEEDQNQK